RRRRDHLAQITNRYYALLAQVVEVHGTDQADLAEVERLAGGRVSVRLSPRAGGAPFYQRTFDRRETDEIRVYLHGGDDRAVVRGRDRLRLPATPLQLPSARTRRLRDRGPDGARGVHRGIPRPRASRRRDAPYAGIRHRCPAVLRLRQRDRRHRLE